MKMMIRKNKKTSTNLNDVVDRASNYVECDEKVQLKKYPKNDRRRSNDDKCRVVDTAIMK